ncbi:aminotransferase class V-fold PLP-dependent enzyme [Vagococcus elongatus]|uniref:cysteine desulfurase n=1 Tax=Vagococcus elongatus TaxID=180344 RepID=A0A430AZQ2_9ENTE|nr:aminotransferase class V-fold PLP-dependent enzyme [Vagococcus elongatus]RSU13545.1 cysteine desulfurase [Vagococcus elongatus]
MIYLDNSATTLKKPDSVIQAVMDALNHIGNPDRGVHEASLESSQLLFKTRQLLCEFFNGEQSSQIVFTSGATESLNLVINGLHEKGDHVITTMMEHNSVLRPLYRLEAQQIIELTILPVDEKGCISYKGLEEAIQLNTKSLIISHGSNVTGNSVNLEKIGKIAAKNDVIFIVDSAQSAGTLPIDIQKQQIDILCFTGHKGLFGPQGTGGLYVNPMISLKPLKVGGSGIATFSKTHPTTMPTALEAGTLNGHGIAGLKAGIEFILNKTLQSIHQHEMSLVQLFYEEVCQIDGVTVYGDFTTKARCPIVSLTIGEEDSSEISDRLASDYGIATRSGGHCAPLIHEALGTKEQSVVRFSFSYFNTEEEVLAAIQALKEIAQ